MFDLPRVIEAATYEIASWIILLPVTLFRLIRNPGAISALVEGEHSKAECDRYDHILSPAIFWLLIGVLPLFYTAFSHAAPPVWMSLPSASSLNEENKLLAFSVVMLGGPFSFLAAVLLTSGSPVTKSALRRPLDSQLYVFAPFNLIYLLAIVTNTLSHFLPSDLQAMLFEYLSLIFILLAFVWFVWAESAVLKYELNRFSKIRIVAAYAVALSAWGFFLLAIYLMGLVAAVYQE